MEDEIEKAILTLADPIAWEWNTDSSPAGVWYGNFGHNQYAIDPPSAPGDVDALPCKQNWRVFPTSDKPRGWYPFSAKSAELAKQICLRHAVTDDISEIAKLHEVGELADKTFAIHEKIAWAQIFPPWLRHNPPRLHWRTDTKEGRTFVSDGSRGTYTVRFDPRRRWIVTLIRGSQVKEEHCFLTRLILRRACCLHAHTGDWIATLQATEQNKIVFRALL